MEFISALLNTKIAKIIILVIFIVLAVILVIQYLNVKSLEKDIDKLNNTVIEKNSVIDDLNNQLKLRQFEIETLTKGIAIANDYHSKTEEVLNESSNLKTDIIEEAMSNEESKDWWNTEIPTNILDMLTCNKSELLQTTSCANRN